MATTFREVRDPVTDKLLFRFDPIHDLVEIGERHRFTLIDLALYREALSDQALDSEPGLVVISDSADY